MNILSVTPLALNDVKVIRAEKFYDDRGYFTETYRKSDLQDVIGKEIVQANECYSKPNVIRGLHFQLSSIVASGYMGKLVRPLQGSMVELILDIRISSPTFGMIIAYEMRTYSEALFFEWLWVPPGFAHGYFVSPQSSYFVTSPSGTLIEYFCTGEYDSKSEFTISPLSYDIDWSLCDSALKQRFADFTNGEHIMSKKDQEGLSVQSWKDFITSNP